MIVTFEAEGIIDALNPPSDILHRADNCTGLRRLMMMIRSSGLIQNRRNLRAYLRAFSLERSSDDGIIYLVSRSEHRPTSMSLIDRGANGGICGDDLSRILLSDKTINVQHIEQPPTTWIVHQYLRCYCLNSKGGCYP